MLRMTNFLFTIFVAFHSFLKNVTWYLYFSIFYFWLRPLHSHFILSIKVKEMVKMKKEENLQQDQKKWKVVNKIILKTSKSILQELEALELVVWVLDTQGEKSTIENTLPSVNILQFFIIKTCLVSSIIVWLWRFFHSKNVEY